MLSGVRIFCGVFYGMFPGEYLPPPGKVFTHLVRGVALRASAT